MFKELHEGKTHSYNDGCGESEHNWEPMLNELVRDLTKVGSMPKSEARARIIKFAKLYAKR